MCWQRLRRHSEIKKTDSNFVVTKPNCQRIPSQNFSRVSPYPQLLPTIFGSLWANCRCYFNPRALLTQKKKKESQKPTNAFCKPTSLRFLFCCCICTYPFFVAPVVSLLLVCFPPLNHLHCSLFASASLSTFGVLELLFDWLSDNALTLLRQVGCLTSHLPSRAAQVRY